MMEHDIDSGQMASLGSDLEAYRDIIRHLYLDQKMTMRNVMGVMQATYGVQSSLSMYKKKIRKWGLNKSAPTARTPSNRGKPPVRYRFVNQTTEAALIQQNRQPVQSIRWIASPAQLKMQEEMIYAGRMHIAQRLDIRLRPLGSTTSVAWRHVPVKDRPKPKGPMAAQAVSFAIMSAADYIAEGHVHLAIKTLNQGFDKFKLAVQEDHFSLSAILAKSLVYLWRMNAVEWIPMVIYQLHAMASICHGDHHFLTLWTKYLFKLFQVMDPPELIELLASIFPNAAEEVLGPEDNYSFISKLFHCEAMFLIRLRRNMMANDVASKMRTVVTQLWNLDPFSNPSYFQVSSYANLMTENMNFAEAEGVFMATIYHGKTINDIIAIPGDPTSVYTTWRHMEAMLCLGLALDGLGRADSLLLFDRAVVMSKEFLNPESNSDLLQICAELLSDARNMDSQTKARYSAMNEHLIPYMKDNLPMVEVLARESGLQG